MILKKFLKEYKLYIILFVVLLFSFFKSLEKVNIISDAITSISIIFAFSQSFVLGIYANDKINVYMKKNNVFDNFIKDNKTFLIVSIYSIIILFILNVVNFNFQYNFEYNYKKIVICFSLYFSSIHIAFFIILFELIKTIEYIIKYMNVYKNSYSGKINNSIKQGNILDNKNNKE